jgi:hypothetical protein
MRFPSQKFSNEMVKESWQKDGFPLSWILMLTTTDFSTISFLNYAALSHLAMII